MHQVHASPYPSPQAHWLTAVPDCLLPLLFHTQLSDQMGRAEIAPRGTTAVEAEHTEGDDALAAGDQLGRKRWVTRLRMTTGITEDTGQSFPCGWSCATLCNAGCAPVLG